MHYAGKRGPRRKSIAPHLIPAQSPPPGVLSPPPKTDCQRARHNTPYDSIRHIGLKLQRQAKNHDDGSEYAGNPDHSFGFKIACMATSIHLRDVPVGPTSLGPYLRGPGIYPSEVVPAPGSPRSYLTMVGWVQPTKFTEKSVSCTHPAKSFLESRSATRGSAPNPDRSERWQSSRWPGRPAIAVVESVDGHEPQMHMAVLKRAGVDDGWSVTTSTCRSVGRRQGPISSPGSGRAIDDLIGRRQGSPLDLAGSPGRPGSGC